jgi:hypothetical protein
MQRPLPEGQLSNCTAASLYLAERGVGPFSTSYRKAGSTEFSCELWVDTTVQKTN